jgi:thiol-disulfide isomerase/thioredoxin
MEPGLTKLSGDLTKSEFAGLTIEAGPQNDFYFRNIWLPFTRVSKTPAEHRAFIASLKSLVHGNPGAFPAMFALKNLGYGMTNAELKSVYDEFDEVVKKGRDGRETKFLLDTTGQLVNMIDTTKKLNMIVFWASWCGPCKQEIPSLKKIAGKFKSDNFRMVSVSIDVDKSQWQSAVDQQQMPWQQLCIEHKDLSRLKAQYNLNAIPQVYFINNKGQMVGKTIWFDTANETKFAQIIAADLK